MSAVETQSPFSRRADRLRRRKAVNRAMEAVAMLSALIGLAILAALVWKIARFGASGLNLDLFTKTENAFAAPGTPQGLANAFAGTLVVVALAAVMAIPVGVLVAIYLVEFAPVHVRKFVSLVLDILMGVPAVVIGVFFYGLLVLGDRERALWASVALGTMMLPLVARSTIEVLLLVPSSLREAALGLGVPRWRTTLGIVVPQTIGGVVTGSILAVSRIAGEAAPLLILSSIVTSPGVSWDPTQALATVPMAILNASESGDPGSYARAWAAALVLTVAILVMSLGARWLAARSRRKLGGSR